MKRIYCSVFLLLIAFGFSNAQYSVKSPHSQVEVKVEVGDQISYSIYFNDSPVLTNSTIRFEFKEAAPLGSHMTILKTSTKEINETWTPVLKRKETILNNCNELTLQMQEKNFPRRLINVVFRVFDDGVAFRTKFIGPDQDHKYVLTEELSTFNFTADHDCWARRFISIFSGK